MSVDEPPYKLQQISELHKTNKLSLGDADFVPLKTYLRRHALNHHNANFARTYVIVGSNNIVIAYITLVAGQIEAERPDVLGDGEPEFQYTHFPCVKIARLAVHSDLQGFGFGQELVRLAIGLVRANVMETVGCRFLTVDSKQKSVKFYKKVGFTMLDTQENKDREMPIMFIDLKKVSE
ncbi:MAG: GNAT family N-acetyltransferase [Proteobacteria bacterium]|nr:GNAT family N-acetyltransferase [Pseudomonadota bacterium]